MTILRSILITIITLFAFSVKAQVTDFEGNIYDTVQIGKQVWLKQNMRSKFYSDGTPVTKPYWAYDNNTSLVGKYGYLYTRDAAYHSDYNFPLHGICPKNYHLPSGYDFGILIMSAGGTDIGHGGYYGANLLKDSILWNGTNTTGFSALPAGIRANDQQFVYFGEEAWFWSLDGVNTLTVFFNTDMMSNSSISLIYPDIQAYSVRCLKNTVNQINEIKTHSFFNLYPNPAGEKINILTEQPLQNSKFYILNILGEMVNSGNFKNEINVSALQAGLYVVIVKTEDNREYRAKFVKE